MHQFKLMLPCSATTSQSNDIFPCKLNLVINDSKLTISLLPNGYSKNINVDYEKWRYAKIYEFYIAFFNENHETNLKLYFFNDTLNLKRLIFALAESGILIPSSFAVLNEMKILPKHSFIPSGEYSFSKKNIPYQIGAILHNKIMGICEKKNIPFNPLFVDSILPKFYQRVVFRANQWKDQETNQNKIRPYGHLKCKKVLNWLLKHVSLQKDYFEYKNQIDHPPKDFIQVFNKINNDISIYRERFTSNNEINNSSNVFSEKMYRICSSVLKVHVLKTGMYYLSGHFEIVKKIGELMLGKSYIPNDDSSVPAVFSDISDDDFELCLFSFYDFLRVPFDLKIESSQFSQAVIDKISYYTLLAFKETAPQVLPYLIVHNISKFNWVTKDFSYIFCNQFENIWPLWCWIYSTKKPFYAFVSVNAALLFLAIPYLLENHIIEEKKISDSWPMIISQVNFDEVMIYSVYFYVNTNFNVQME
ncbi:hypothetical protein TRFO_25279 [Tritrichomonas foetus]|uniref:Uncharacterized protein n=1 Tax=Tritrichomonas foetus TaxID=1144522 RepID=A0A1J4K617_9EUKA|nr:hypothetical protein TRFO_25279 [Tritrichomonas foetus]|eukprot:OHT06611.1 hypothetical protein TRFO_25279 [Tritrichomonas foetus]